ncbi:hypothetical protein BDZ45DRAFT_547396, partial [Acephala macrosclerotiorum]
RIYHDWSISHVRPAKHLPFCVCIVRNKTQKCFADVEFRFISSKTEKEVKETITRKGIVVNENGMTGILSSTMDTTCGEPYVLTARLFIDDVCVSRGTDWPQPFQYLSFKDCGVTVETISEQIRVTAKRPTKRFAFEERDGVSLSGNAVDIVPGDKHIINAKGLHSTSKPLSFRYLGQD